jgi:hypothetical protein
VVIYLNMVMDTVATMTCTPVTTIRDMMDMRTWAMRCQESPEMDLRDLVNFKDINHIKFKVV